jgi:hypothetical protein
MYNGGITLAISRTNTTALTISTVTSYQPSWETVSESFEQNDPSLGTYTLYRGDRFTASVTTGILTLSEMETLRSALLQHEFTLYCPEFPATQSGGGIFVRLTSLSQPLEVANYGRKYYRMSFAVAAVALINGGSL